MRNIHCFILCILLTVFGLATESFVAASLISIEPPVGGLSKIPANLFEKSFLQRIEFTLTQRMKLGYSSIITPKTNPSTLGSIAKIIFDPKDKDNIICLNGFEHCTLAFTIQPKTPLIVGQKFYASFVITDAYGITSPEETFWVEVGASVKATASVTVYDDYSPIIPRGLVNGTPNALATDAEIGFTIKKNPINNNNNTVNNNKIRTEISGTLLQIADVNETYASTECLNDPKKPTCEIDFIVTPKETETLKTIPKSLTLSASKKLKLESKQLKATTSLKTAGVPKPYSLSVQLIDDSVYHGLVFATKQFKFLVKESPIDISYEDREPYQILLDHPIVDDTDSILDPINLSFKITNTSSDIDLSKLDAKITTLNGNEIAGDAVTSNFKQCTHGSNKCTVGIAITPNMDGLNAFYSTYLDVDLSKDRAEYYALFTITSADNKATYFKKIIEVNAQATRRTFAYVYFNKSSVNDIMMCRTNPNTGKFIYKDEDSDKTINSFDDISEHCESAFDDSNKNKFKGIPILNVAVDQSKYRIYISTPTAKDKLNTRKYSVCEINRNTGKITGCKDAFSKPLQYSASDDDLIPRNDIIIDSSNSLFYTFSNIKDKAGVYLTACLFDKKTGIINGTKCVTQKNPEISNFSTMFRSDKLGKNYIIATKSILSELDDAAFFLYTCNATKNDGDNASLKSLKCNDAINEDNKIPEGEDVLANGSFINSKSDAIYIPHILSRDFPADHTSIIGFFYKYPIKNNQLMPWEPLGCKNGNCPTRDNPRNLIRKLDNIVPGVNPLQIYMQMLEHIRKSENPKIIFPYNCLINTQDNNIKCEQLLKDEKPPSEQTPKEKSSMNGMAIIQLPITSAH